MLFRSPIFSNHFYPPNIWSFFESNFKTEEFNVESNGLFKEAERRMISFNNNCDSCYKYKVLAIKNISKFNKLGHKDYLGAILGLGINRNKLGDLLVKEDCCFFPVSEEIADFLMVNLTSVGNSNCKVSEIKSIDKSMLEFDFENITVLVQTLRLDSVVSKLANISRVKAQSYIENGRVLLNYKVNRNRSIILTENSRITIRGIGKFIVDKSIGNSKSGKIKVKIKKYS